MKKPSWKLVDWTESKNYEHIDIKSNPSDEVCAWEFLRRNPQYQNDFSEYERTKKFPGYTRYVLSSDGQYIPHYEDMLDWYGLSRESVNLDPRIATPPAFVKGDYPRFLQKDDLLEFATTTDTDEDFLESKQNEVVVVFSANQNLDNQFDRIKNQLKLRQDIHSPFRKRKQLYKTYLRLLDADLMDATEAEIMEKMYSEGEKFRTVMQANLKSAKKLRDFNYKKLLAF